MSPREGQARHQRVLRQAGRRGRACKPYRTRHVVISLCIMTVCIMFGVISSMIVILIIIIDNIIIIIIISSSSSSSSIMLHVMWCSYCSIMVTSRIDGA